MRMMLLLSLCAAGCAESPDRTPEVARVHAHLARVEAELRATPTEALSAPQRHARASTLDLLHRYALAERYPTNDVQPGLTPIFISRDGARCAMAALLEATGHAALVQRIAATDNLVRIAALAHDAELGAWLTEHGLTLSEAARIQPSYANHTVSRWHPTVSGGAAVLGGANTATSAELVVAPLLRAGLRRITQTIGSCDVCVSYGVGLLLEYARDVHFGGRALDSVDRVGLLLMWDLGTQRRDYQWYLLGGPLGTFDENARPGLGFGGQLGAGFSTRGRSFPFFVEVLVAGLKQGAGLAVRGGVAFGVVFDGPGLGPEGIEIEIESE